MLVSVLTMLASAESKDIVLTLDDAVSLALTNNPDVLLFESQAESHSNYEKSSIQLPQPMFRTGLVNVPVDEFELNAEAMTHTVIGFRQRIPPKQLRRSEGLNHKYQAEAMQWLAAAEKKQAVYDTRIAWLSSHLYQQEILLTLNTSKLLDGLTKIVRTRYAAGEELQLAVLTSELEGSRINSRLLVTQRLQQNALDDLKRLVGLDEDFTVATDLSEWNTVPNISEVKDTLLNHPKVKAAAALVEAETAQIEHNEAKFKPEWHIDLSYGLRSGTHSNRQERPDLASAMVSVNLPWFSKQQKQLKVNAARSSQQAAHQFQIALIRDMQADLAKAYDDWHSLSDQLELLANQIVPQSQSHAQAALQAYQNKQIDYGDVLRSYIAEIDARLDWYRVKVDRLKTWAKIDALNGGSL